MRYYVQATKHNYGGDMFLILFSKKLLTRDNERPHIA